MSTKRPDSPIPDASSANAALESLMRGVLDPFVARMLARGGTVAAEGSAGSLPSFVAAAAARQASPVVLVVAHLD
ncbi:MAG: hypothetical protein RLY21_2783, partial [Planctomycetota bacterium]